MSINQKIIKNKIGLLNLAQELGNISKACKIMGYSRDTFYRYQELVESGGVENLMDKSRRKPNLKNRVDEETEAAVIKIATDYPAYGQLRASNELRKKGVIVSPQGVRSIWLRNNLSVFKDRLRALEEISAKENVKIAEKILAQPSHIKKKNEKKLILSMRRLSTQ